MGKRNVVLKNVVRKQFQEQIEKNNFAKTFDGTIWHGIFTTLSERKNFGGDSKRFHG